MALFNKKPAPPAQPVTCPVCGESFAPGSDLAMHWLNHVELIPPGHGEASGQFTWSCSCGPSGMKWPGRGGAAIALQYHVARAHGVPSMEEFLLATADGQANMRHLRNRLS